MTAGEGSPGGAGDPDVLERLDDIGRLLVLLVQKDRSAQDVIEELASVGMRGPRIAALMGKRPNYVRVALGRAKKGRTRKPTTTKR